MEDAYQREAAAAAAASYSGVVMRGNLSLLSTVDKYNLVSSITQKH